VNRAGLASVLRQRAALRAHDRWTHDEILAYQAGSLAELRAYAKARSPIYRDLHRGLEAAPLTELPVVTKSILMARFDDLVTDRDVHLADVERYLESATATELSWPARRALAGVGARHVAISVELVEAIPRTALGKAPLIRHARPAGAGH
jgi:hypothetical protein